MFPVKSVNHVPGLYLPSPNISLQRTRVPRFARFRSPLSSQPLGGRPIAALKASQAALQIVDRVQSQE